MADYYYYDTNINSTCPEGYELYYKKALFVWNFHLRGALSGIIIIFNTLVVLMFTKNNHWTPATILFILLAISDSIASICQSLPLHFALLFGFVGQEITDYPTIDHKFCSFMLITEGPLYFAMHDTSILLTTMLGILKALAIKFPLWFRNHVGKKVPIVGAVCFFITALCIEMYPVFTFSFRPDVDGWCCFNEAFANYIYEFSIVGQWVLPIMYFTAYIILLFTSSYIAGKLTCFRSSFEFAQTTTVATKRKRQSAIMVVVITVVFMITELTDFLCITSPLLMVFGAPDMFELDWYRKVFQFSELFVQLGFSSNFVIYMITSKETRNNLKNLLICRCLTSRCRYLVNGRSSSRSATQESKPEHSAKVRKMPAKDDSLSTETPWAVPGQDLDNKSEIDQKQPGVAFP